MRLTRRSCLQLLAAATLVAACTTPAEPSLPPPSRSPSPSRTPGATRRGPRPPAPEATPARTSRVPVRIERENGRFRYLIGDTEATIHGMGYNVLYQQRGLPPDEREARLREDFELLRAIGVNTLQSWEDPEVDELHLDLALEHGLDVIPYYHLPKRDDYSKRAVQDQHRARLEDWMEHWIDHPAIVMWGIGNEVLLSATAAQSETFAEYYATLVELARKVDPTRPVVYREAEDVRVPYFRDAFEAAGGTPDQFVYGLNCYTARLAEILDDWPDRDWDVPLFVSEFAPTGLPLDERPEGFRRLWQVIDAHRDRVLGGAVYTWATEGPEATDHVFGLVNDMSQPLDASLLVLSELWDGSYGQPRAATVRVPAVTGYQEGEARATLYAAGLHLQIVQGRFLSQLPSTVRAQRPRAGLVVQRGSTVRIVVPPRPAPAESPAALEALFEQARDAGLPLATASEAEFQQTRQAAEAATERMLAARARSEADRQKAARLAEWQGWITALARLETPEDEVFPGAVNIIPVFDGLARYAMADSRAFTQAENFARAAVAEWLAAVGA